MRITCTNGNSQNGIKGSRITIKTNGGEIIDRFVVPTREAKAYCERHPNGIYGKRYFNAVKKCEEIENS